MNKIFLFLILFAMAPNVKAGTRAIITASLNTAQKQAIEIEFKIKVLRDVQIATAYLPWKTPLNFTFIVMPVGTGVGLPRFYPVYSPAIGDTKLKKGVTYKGEMELSGYFPSIVKESAKQDLIFLWYMPILPDRQDIDIINIKKGSKGYGGWVLIPRNYLQNHQ